MHEWVFEHQELQEQPSSLSVHANPYGDRQVGVVVGCSRGEWRE